MEITAGAFSSVNIQENKKISNEKYSDIEDRVKSEMGITLQSFVFK